MWGRRSRRWRKSVGEAREVKEIEEVEAKRRPAHLLGPRSFTSFTVGDCDANAAVCGAPTALFLSSTFSQRLRAGLHLCRACGAGSPLW